MRKPVYAICEHPHSLISAFVVRCLDSMIYLVSISEISSLHLVSVAAQAGLCLTWSQTSKTGFLMMRLIYSLLLLSWLDRQLAVGFDCGSSFTCLLQVNLTAILWPFQQYFSSN